jgi:DNA-directed RNA polymerase subunit E'/Rpb7
MEHSALFEERASLTSRDLRGQITDIDGLLLQKISTRMEGKCSRHGFVLPDTMKILSRSMGYVEKGRFTGDIIFHLQLEGKVLNPPAGQSIVGTVVRKNKMGMYVSYDNDSIRIILPRDIHIGDEKFEAVQIGERVRVEIQKSRFQVNDPYILSVGLFREVVTEAAPAVAQEVAPAVAQEVAPAAALEVASEGASEEEEESKDATANNAESEGKDEAESKVEDEQ